MAEEKVKHSPAAASLLFANLGFFNTEIPPELESYLYSLLDYSFDEFAERGIFLSVGNIRDDMDQMVYAAWMYRNGTTGAGKTEMLKSIIRNRQVSAALKEGA